MQPTLSIFVRVHGQDGTLLGELAQPVQALVDLGQGHRRCNLLDREVVASVEHVAANLEVVEPQVFPVAVHVPHLLVSPQLSPDLGLDPPARQLINIAKAFGQLLD